MEVSSVPVTVDATVGGATLIAATGHDRFAIQDYERLQQTGIGRASDGVRWHLVERSPGSTTDDTTDRFRPLCREK